MVYNRCGNSGLKLPAISLGLWQNFGYAYSFDNIEKMCHTAFDLGITHFDIANNYGAPYNGSSEENFARVLDRGMRAYRDELCISTKAGFEMWPGPYGDRNGSRKYLTASLDQSLKRLGLDYVDIFYHHVYDPETPLEETALALDNAVRQGKALYVGVSNYGLEETKAIHKIFKELKTPFVVNQPSYSMLNRWIEDCGLDDYAKREGIGIAVYSPLYQGFLTDKYLGGISDSPNAGRGKSYLIEQLTPQMIAKLNKLNVVAEERGQKLSQMALSWILRNGKITTVLMGASTPEQIAENVQAVSKTKFSDEETELIEAILAE